VLVVFRQASYRRGLDERIEALKLRFQTAVIAVDSVFELALSQNHLTITQHGISVDLFDVECRCLFLFSTFDDHRFSQPRKLGKRSLRPFEIRQWRAALDAVYFLLDEGYVANHPLNASRAANRAIAKRVLSDVGIPIWPSLVTNDLRSIQTLVPRERYMVKHVSDTSYVSPGFLSAPFSLSEDVMADTLGILAAPLDYQQIAALSAEHRVYVFGDEAVCLQLNIPVENRANVIDPRFQMDISKQTSVCENDEITTIALLSARALHVQIVAIDIITVQRLHYVIDVNPHASWHWLSHEVCSAIQTKFESFVATLLMKKNVGAADIIAKGVAKDIALLSH
jgi:hypothetical protein